MRRYCAWPPAFGYSAADHPTRPLARAIERRAARDGNLGCFAIAFWGTRPVDYCRGRFLLVHLACVAATSCWATAQGAEPSRLSWKPRAAAKYLDERADWWLSWPSAARGAETSCIACHTGMPFALARPALRRSLGEAPSRAESTILDRIKQRVAHWDNVSSETRFKAFYSEDRKPSALGTEAVLNALVLVNHDSRVNGGTLSDRAKQSLD